MTLSVDMAGGPAPTLIAPWLLAQTSAPAPAAASPAPAAASAQASGTAAGDAAQPSSLLSMLPLVLMLIGVYFLLIAPQSKRQKQQQKMLNSIETGDEVITTGGVYGVVTGIKSDRFVIEIAKGVRIEVSRANVEARAATPDKPEDKKA